MKKELLKNYLKFGLLLFGICIITFACQEESIRDVQEVPQERTVKRISLNELNNRIGNSHGYTKLSPMFDVNHTETSGLSRRLEASDNPYLLTDEIVVVEKENSTFYTFKIESDAIGNEFYNLVVVMDEFNEIRSAKILEYTPSTSWLEDTSQPFKGELKTQVNDILQRAKSVIFFQRMLLSPA